MEKFFILTEAMYQSLGQGIVIYLASRLILLSFPQLPAVSRYNILCVSQGLIFLLFCFNIFEGSRIWDQYSAAAAVATQYQDPVPARFFSVRAMIMSQAPLIGKLYFLGLGVQCLFFIHGLIRVRGLKNGGTAVPEEWNGKLEAWCGKLGITRRVTLLSGHRTSVPVTAGFLKPVIYFPITAFNNLTVEQAEAILLHELAHIRRNDYLVNLVQKTIEMIMFFNPVCRSLGAEIRKEREFCCDDLVVAHTSAPEAYASGLFVLEQKRGDIEPALSAAGPKSHTLLERIKRITDMNNHRLTLKPGMYALLGFLAAGLSLAWITPATEADLKQNTGRTAGRAAQKTPLKVQTLVLDTVPAPDTTAIKKYFNSPEWKKQEAEIKANAEQLKKHFESPEWKKHMADVQKNAEEMKKHFNSPEWKEHQKMLAQQGEKMKEYFESPEWKKHVQEIEARSKEMAKAFDSPEWKEKMKKLELNSQELEKKFNSPEWKSKMKEIEMSSQELEKKFNSPEWKEKMKKLELSSRELEKKFNSPEWKEKMKKLEESTRELEKKFNSPEWKNQMKEFELNGEEWEKKSGSPESGKKQDVPEKAPENSGDQ